MCFFQWFQSSVILFRNSLLILASCSYFTFHDSPYSWEEFSVFFNAYVKALLTLNNCFSLFISSLIQFFISSTKVLQLIHAVILLLNFNKPKRQNKKSQLAQLMSKTQINPRYVPQHILQQFDMKQLIREELLNIIIIAVFLLQNSNCQNECSPAFTLPNILKGICRPFSDQVSLQYNDGTEQTNSYLFFSGIFSGQPSIGYSISQLSIQQTNTAVNYYLDVEIQDMYIYFYFNSPNFKWTIASVIFWIASRNDLVIIKNVLKNLTPGQNSSLSFDINNPVASIDAQSTHIVFLVGLYSNFSNNLTISVNPGSLTSTKAAISIFAGANVRISNITVLSVIYNPKLGQYLSSSGVLNYKTFKNQFFNIFNNFVPIYYVLAGINSLILTEANLNNFQYHLDIINSTILQSSSINTFDSLGVSYATIGVQTKSVCSPCNNFIYNGNCAASCPASTYPFTFADGGKACLSCDSRVGQILNSLSNGCNCFPGFELISANQCVNSNSGTTTCTGVNVIQNGTTCICSPGTFNISGTCGACPAGQIFQSGTCIANSNCPSNSSFSAALGRCICNSGFMNISNGCTPCQQGQFYDNAASTCKCIGMNQQINSTGACVCISGFYNMNGFCISCPEGSVYDGNTCVTQACAKNQISVNGTCICDSLSITVGSLCIKCETGTFANKATNLCDACISNCISCINKISCLLCKEGFIFDFASLKCFTPNAAPTTTASKIVSIKSGFPFYTIQGIITDFMINSTVFTTRTKADLANMVSLSFSDLSTIPYNIYYSQNAAQLNNIRVAFYYKALIPLSKFNVTYSFKDTSLILEETITLTYQYSTNKLQFKNY